MIEVPNVWLEKQTIIKIPSEKSMLNNLMKNISSNYWSSKFISKKKS